MPENIEFFNIVDNKGIIIGEASRAGCHNGSKILHPVVHIHIFNSKKQLLLQKRKSNKDIQPGKWDTSVGGHIQAGESINNALLREAKEEVNISINLNEIIPLKNYIYESDVEKEYVYSFIYYYDGKIDFQKSEIDNVKYYSIDEINKLIKKGNTTPNFIKEFNLLKESKLSLF
jgi:isopentenyl-diphosphate delta-isomerase type 1